MGSSVSGKRIIVPPTVYSAARPPSNARSSPDSGVTVTCHGVQHGLSVGAWVVNSLRIESTEVELDCSQTLRLRLGHVRFYAILAPYSSAKPSGVSNLLVTYRVTTIGLDEILCRCGRGIPYAWRNNPFIL